MESDFNITVLSIMQNSLNFTLKCLSQKGNSYIVTFKTVKIKK